MYLPMLRGVVLVVAASALLTPTAAAGQVSALFREAQIVGELGGGWEDSTFVKPPRDFRTEMLPENVCHARVADCMQEVFPFRPFRPGELSLLGAGVGGLVGVWITKRPEAAVILGTAGAVAVGRLDKYAWRLTEAYCRSKYCFGVVEHKGASR